MTQTDEYFLESKPLFSGKIREVYNFSDDKILIKTSDKISAYDFVFEDELPNKGALLTKISTQGLIRRFLREKYSPF